MATNGIQYTQDDTLRAIAEKAIASSDNFVVRVARRRQNGLFAEQIASLDNATVSQISNADSWLPVLVGGGELVVKVAHHDQPGDKIGGELLFLYNPSTYPPKTPPDVRAVERQDWAGPGRLTFPVPGAVPGLSSTPIHREPMGEWTTPGQNPPGTTFIIGADGRPAAAGVGVDSNHEAKLREIAQREAALERQQLKSEMESRIREMESRLAAASKPATPAESSMNVEKLVAAIGPIMMQFLQMQADQRTKMMEMDARAREAAAVAAAKAAETQMLLLQKMTERPAMSEETKMFITSLQTQNANNGSGEMMSRMVEAMGAVSSTSVEMIRTLAEINSGEPENQWVGAIKEAALAVAPIFKGATEGAKKVARQQMQQQQQLPLPMQAQRPAGPQPMPQQPQQQRPPQPAAAPVHPPLAVVPTPPPANQAFGEAPAAQPSKPLSTVDTVEKLIRAHANPTEVAAYVVKLLETKDPAFMEELEQNDHEPAALIGNRLGDSWLSSPENFNYISEIDKHFTELAEAAGLLEDEEEGVVEPEAQTDAS